MSPEEAEDRIRMALSETHPHIQPLVRAVAGDPEGSVRFHTGQRALSDEERPLIRKAAITAGLPVMCDQCWDARLNTGHLARGIDCLHRGNPPIFDCGQEHR